MKDELTNVLSNMQIASTIMYAIAPCSPILFAHIDFVVFGIEINQYNCVALVMILILMVSGILAYFFLSNLTRHPGYQIYIEQIRADTDTGSIKKVTKVNKPSNQTQNENKQLTRKDIFSDRDLRAIMVGNCLIAFVYALGEISINIVAMKRFN